jgi:hypothetical protein
MRNIVILLLFIVFCFSVKAQDKTENPSRSRVTLNYGLAIPKGEFALIGVKISPEIASKREGAGHATNSTQISLEYAYLLKKHFYLNAMYRYQSHNSDFKVPEPLASNYFAETSDWKIKSAFIGFGGRVQFLKIFELNTYVMIGNTTTNSPSLHSKSFWWSGFKTDTTNSIRSNSLSYNLGQKLITKISPKLELVLSVDYFYTEVKNKNVTTKTNHVDFLDNVDYNIYKQNDKTFKINIENYSIGISYKI